MVIINTTEQHSEWHVTSMYVNVSTCMRMDTQTMAWLAAHNHGVLLPCLLPNVCLRKWVSVLVTKLDMPSDLKIARMRFVKHYVLICSLFFFSLLRDYTFAITHMFSPHVDYIICLAKHYSICSVITIDALMFWFWTRLQRLWIELGGGVCYAVGLDWEGVLMAVFEIVCKCKWSDRCHSSTSVLGLLITLLVMRWSVYAHFVD